MRCHFKADFKVKKIPEDDRTILPVIVTNAELFVAACTKRRRCPLSQGNCPRHRPRNCKQYRGFDSARRSPLEAKIWETGRYSSYGPRSFRNGLTSLILQAQRLHRTQTKDISNEGGLTPRCTRRPKRCR